MFYNKKGKIYRAYVSKNNSNREKTSYSFDDSKQRRMALYCSKTITVIKKYNVKTPLRFLLFELSSFF